MSSKTIYKQQMSRTKRKAKQAAGTERKTKQAIAKQEKKGAGKVARRTRKAEQKTKKQTEKGNRKTARKEARTTRSQNRTDKRTAMSFARTEKRKQAGLKRVSKRLGGKYGDIDESLAEAALLSEGATPELAEALIENGIEVTDPSDPIEVITKFVQTDPDMPDPIPDDEYNQAFLISEEEGEDFENFDKDLALKYIGGALGGVTTTFMQHADTIAEKEKRGEALTEKEKKILSAKKSAEKNLKETVSGAAKNKFFPVVVGAALLLLLIAIFK